MLHSGTGRAERPSGTDRSSYVVFGIKEAPLPEAHLLESRGSLVGLSGAVLCNQEYKSPLKLWHHCKVEMEVLLFSSLAPIGYSLALCVSFTQQDLTFHDCEM